MYKFSLQVPSYQKTAGNMVLKKLAQVVTHYPELLLVSEELVLKWKKSMEFF